MDQSFDDLAYRINNILIQHTGFKKSIAKIDQCYKSSLNQSDSTCIAIVGESRSGKTRILEHFETNHKPRRVASGLITPVVKIKVDSKPTVKSLAQELLYNLGDPIYNKGTENAMTIRLRKLLCESETKIIMLDEFQHFYDQGSHKIQHSVADWLKNIIEDTRIGLVVAGLPTCIHVIESNIQLVRRFHKPITISRFDWSKENERNEFRSILHTLQESLKPLSFPVLSSLDMSQRIYHATGGLMGYVVKLIREASIVAIDNNKHTIEMKDLMSAYDSTIWDKSHENSNPFSDEFNKSFTTYTIKDGPSLEDNKSTSHNCYENDLNNRTITY